MIFFIFACLIGIIAGLRSMIAPAAVSLAAHFGILHLDGTGLAFFGYAATAYIFTFLAILELIGDQHPSTPSRKAFPGFQIRIIMGALCGAAISMATGQTLLSFAGIIGLVLGIIGAVIGTIGGAAFRAYLAKAFGKDRPAALIEDLIAILGATLIILALG